MTNKAILGIIAFGLLGTQPSVPLVNTREFATYSLATHVIVEEKWHLKEVQGQTIGDFTSKTQEVHYVYEKEKKKRIIHEKDLTSLENTVTLMRDHSTGPGGGGTTTSISGEIAGMLSGSILFGQVKDAAAQENSYFV